MYLKSKNSQNDSLNFGKLIAPCLINTFRNVVGLRIVVLRVCLEIYKCRLEGVNEAIDIDDAAGRLW